MGKIIIGRDVWLWRMDNFNACRAVLKMKCKPIAVEGYKLVRCLLQVYRINLSLVSKFMFMLCCFIIRVYFLLFLQYLMRKTTSAVKPKAVFNPKDYEKPGLPLEEILEIKEAFDLFDYEGAGIIDCN